MYRMVYAKTVAASFSAGQVIFCTHGFVAVLCDYITEDASVHLITNVTTLAADEILVLRTGNLSESHSRSPCGV